MTFLFLIRRWDKVKVKVKVKAASTELSILVAKRICSCRRADLQRVEGDLLGHLRGYSIPSLCFP